MVLLLLAIMLEFMLAVNAFMLAPSLLNRLSFPSCMRALISCFSGLLDAAAWLNFKTCWATDGEEKDLLF